MIEVEPLKVEETDTDLARCRVITTDATGETREYSIGLDPTQSVRDEIVQSGRRVDDNAPDKPAGGGVPNRVFETSREYFEKQGYKVY